MRQSLFLILETCGAILIVGVLLVVGGVAYAPALFPVPMVDGQQEQQTHAFLDDHVFKRVDPPRSAPFFPFLTRAGEARDLGAFRGTPVLVNL